MVLTELLQNALEHGFGTGESGEVEVAVTRGRELITVAVQDNGRGLPAGFDAQQTGNLGLQIVRTLVVGDLGGSFDMRPAPSTGTQVILELPLEP
jgi:two-component sensor histidine kinase